MLPQRTRIETAVQLALEGATVLTSSTRAARQLHTEYAFRQKEHGGAWETPSILPLDAWLESTWTECLLAGLVDAPLLRPAQANALWNKIVSDSAYGSNLLNVHGAASSAIAAWKLLHEYELPLTRQLYAATEETRAFFDWTRAFVGMCQRNSWIDPVSAGQKIAGLAERIPNRPAKVAAFGFDGFTPSQLQLWSALGHAGSDITLLTPDLRSPQGSALCAGLEDSETELRAAAAWARRRLETDPAARIGVVAVGLESVRARAEGIFEETLHPERLVLPASGSARCFDISLGVPISEYAIVRHALLVIRLAVAGLAPGELSSLLRSPHTGGSVSEFCSRAQVDVAQRSKLRNSNSLKAVARLMEEEGGSIPVLRSSLRGMMYEAERLPGRLGRSEWSYHARRILNAAGWPGDGEGGRKRSSVEFQATDAWESLLKEFAALDVVESPASPMQLLRELETLANDRTFAPENQSAPVQVLGTLEAAGDSFDALWICGLNDEAWPPAPHVNPCIPLGLQRQSGIPAATSEASLAQASLVTSRLLQSAEDCVLTWPRRDEDRDLRPSSLLARIPPGDAASLASIPPRWAPFGHARQLETFTDEVAPPIADVEVIVRGTRLLERQSNCPFQSYAGNRLSAEAIERVSLGLDPKQRGKLVEAVLQKIWERLRTWNRLAQPEIPEPDIDRIIIQAVNESMGAEYPIPEERWEQQYRDLERERLLVLAREWLELEKKREPFEVVDHQQKIEFEIGGVRVHGRIDRVDRTRRGDYVVIDYKTGRGPYSIQQWTVPRPRRPQLPLYTVAQMDQGREIAGVAYAHLRSGQSCFKADARDKGVLGINRLSDPGGFQDRIAQWKPELARLAEGFLAGHSEVDPKTPPHFSNSPCTYCPQDALCRVAEMEFPEPRIEADDDE